MTDNMVGKRVEEFIKEWRETDDLLELAPHTVGLHPLNRGGANPNAQTLHFKILGSFYKDGYDSGRHLPPIVVRCSSDQSRKNLVEHNLRYSEGRPEFPPPRRRQGDGVWYDRGLALDPRNAMHRR